MTGKILKSILSVATAVLIASFIIITGALYNYFGGVQKSQLKDELNLAARGAEELGEEYLSGLDFGHYRLTWIDSDGSVRFDSQVDASEMENHADREEIKEALETGKGSSNRYSTTLTEQNIYEAVLLEDGTVLRISVSRATVVSLLMGMMQPVAFIIIVSVVLSILLAQRMAKRVMEPLNRLDLDNPLENDAYEEISPLLRRIHAQQQEIGSQLQALKNKQEELEQITGNMKEVLVLLDGEGRVISINPAAKELFSVDNCEGVDFISIDRTQNLKEAVDTAISQGSYSYRELKKQREYQFELSCIKQENQVRGMVLLGFDITEQVNAEKNRRQFTANVSHELKTPLQSIVGSAELLENGIVKQEDMPRFVGHIKKEAERLVVLIEDIIRLSQLDEGENLPTEELSLYEVAEGVRENLADTAKRKNIGIELTGDTGNMEAVHRLIYEIVYNLCDNAIKYNRDGGKVGINIESNVDTVTLSVSDTGIGIEKEEQEKIFERFYRVDKSHSKQSGGTGLGLSIVKHAVAYHHGKIYVDSKIGVGTTISVVFSKISEK